MKYEVKAKLASVTDLLSLFSLGLYDTSALQLHIVDRCFRSGQLYGNDSHYSFHRCDEAQGPRRDAQLTHMADDVVLNTPLASEPVKGKTAIRQVAGALLKVVDKFDFLEFMQGPEHVLSFFKLASGAIELDGMDYWRLNGTGLIKEMRVLWRPLPEATEVQKKLG